MFRAASEGGQPSQGFLDLMHIGVGAWIANYRRGAGDPAASSAGRSSRTKRGRGRLRVTR
jgi:hypothetical protein